MTAVSAAPAVQCPACTVPGRATTLTLAVPDGRVATLLRCPSCGTEFWSAGPRIGTAGAAEGSEPDSDASEYWEQYKFELYADVAVREAYEERYARMLALLDRPGPAPREPPRYGRWHRQLRRSGAPSGTCAPS